MGPENENRLASVIHRRKLVEHPHLVVLDPSRPIAGETFRQVCMRIDRARGAINPTPQVVTVTSAVPGEGKTTMALNLALALAEDRDRSTLLVDADLRLPALAHFLEPEPEIGLSDVLSGAATLTEALIKSVDNAKLAMLAGGMPCGTPLELLRSQRFADMLAELRRRYDRIVIDSAPVVPFADTEVLIDQSDGVVFVVRAGKTGKQLVDKMAESVPREKLLGTILNDVQRSPVGRYYERYDHDAYLRRQSAARNRAPR